MVLNSTYIKTHSGAFHIHFSLHGLYRKQQDERFLVILVPKYYIFYATKGKKSGQISFLKLYKYWIKQRNEGNFDIQKKIG